MEAIFKKICGKGYYHDFEEQLNYFEYFNIKKQDLEVVHRLLNENKDRMSAYMLEIEDAIKLRIDYFSSHIKDENNRFTLKVAPELEGSGKAFMAGIIFTAARLLGQETVFLRTLDITTTNIPITVPKVDEEVRHNYNDYITSQRIFFEGLSGWAYSMLDTTSEMLAVLSNLDSYVDQNIMNVKDYKDLFIWLWVWSHLRVANEMYSYQSTLIMDNARYPELNNNLLNLFTYKVDVNIQSDENDDENKVNELIGWENPDTLDLIETALEDVHEDVKIYEQINFHTYFKAMDSVMFSYTFFNAYMKKGYIDDLRDTIAKRSYEQIDVANIASLVQDITYKVYTQNPTFRMEFYNNGFYSKPLFEIQDENQESFLIAFPEFIWISSYMTANYDLVESEVRNRIKYSMRDKLKNITDNSLMRVDKKLKLNLYANMQNFNYSAGKTKKNEKAENFDQVFFDYKTNRLYICEDFYFKPDPCIWADWKDDIKMLLGRDCYAARFIELRVKRFVKEQMKRLKKDFPIIESTKITAVIFTNKSFNYYPRILFDDIELYIINVSTIEKFLTSVVYKKHTKECVIDYDVNIEIKKTKNKWD